MSKDGRKRGPEIGPSFEGIFAIPLDTSLKAKLRRSLHPDGKVDEAAEFPSQYGNSLYDKKIGKV